MKTVEMKVFTINELSENVRNKIVREQQEKIARYWGYDDMDWLCCSFVDDCKNANIEVEKNDIHVSFYSGNDYASFSGEYTYKENETANYSNLPDRYKKISEFIDTTASKILEIYKNFYERISDNDKEFWYMYDTGHNSMTAYITENRRQDGIEEVSIYCNGMEFSENDLDGFPELKKEYSGLVTDLQGYFEDFAFEFRKDCESAYDYDTGEEAALERLENEELYYLEDGTEVSI